MSEVATPERVASEMAGRPRADGMRGAILGSIIGPIAWLCLTLLYVGFWAQGFSLFQSLIIIIVSALILAGVMGALWTSYGTRHHWSMEP
jgi:hypothetical protein